MVLGLLIRFDKISDLALHIYCFFIIDFLPIELFVNILWDRSIHPLVS